MPTTARRVPARPADPLPDPRPARSRRSPAPGARRGARVLAGALAAVLLLSGCGLRWETPPPAEPVPDAAEAARRGAVEAADALAAAARAAADGAPEAAAPVLALVTATADDQVAALGGPYDSGIPAATPSPTPSPSAAAADPADVLTLLGEAASTARADARTAEEPGLARLLAAVAASRAQLADRLAAALGVEPPAVDADPGPDWPQGGAADGSGSGDGSASTPSATPSASPSGTPGAGADADALGTDVDRATLVGLVLAEDQAGHGFEVAAARLSGGARDAARSAAARHRAAAGTWAEAAGIAGTRDDPRRVAYALDGDLGSAEGVRAFCAGLLTDLAAVHADAVLETSAGTVDRDAAVDGLRTASVEALAWGAEPVALPGLPEVAATPAPTADPTTAG